MELSGSRWGEQDVLCCVHGERQASMRVNVEKGLFFCHACQAKGTVIDLIRAMESCTRQEAEERAEKLAQAAGVALLQRPGRSRYQRPGTEGAPQAAGRRYVPPGRRSA